MGSASVVSLASGSQKIIASDGAPRTDFGSSVDIDGPYMIVGAPNTRSAADQQVGAAYIYFFDGENWIFQARLDNVDSDQGSRFGSAVSISGNTVVVGAYFARLGTSNNQGAIYVFVREGSTWSFQQRMDAMDSAPFTSLGSSVSIDGDTIVAGAPQDVVNGGRTGSAYVFSRVGGQWTRIVKLTDVDSTSPARFGYGISVDINKDTVVVGARYGTLESNERGVAVIYRKTDMTWSREAQVTGSDVVSGDEFGIDVSIHDNSLVVGAMRHRHGGPAAIGAAYVFARVGNVWTEKQELLPADIDATFFGNSVGLSGERIMIGAPLSDVRGNSQQGASYAFVLRGNSWVLQNRLLAFDGRAADRFGTDVAIQGNRFFCGSPGVDIADPIFNSNEGAVYFSVESPGLPDLQNSADSGISSTDNITKSGVLTFDVGGMTPGAFVELLRNGAVVDSKIVDQTEATFTDAAAFSDGTFQYTTRQTVGLEVSSQSEPLHVTVDRTAPTVTLDQAIGQADPTAFSPLRFQVVISETVSGFDASDISFAGSTAQMANASTSLAEPNMVLIDNVMSNGQFVMVSIPAGSFVDPAGNSSLASTHFDNKITVDNVRPTVTINQAPGQADPTATQPLNYSVEFSEPVFGFDAADIHLVTLANVTNASVVVTGSGANYNVAVSGLVADSKTVLVRTAGLPAAIQDALGNWPLESTSTDNVVLLDNVGPSVYIHLASNQFDPTNRIPVNFRVEFSEPVIGFDAADISLSGSTVDVSNAAVLITGSGTSYNVAVSNIVLIAGGVVRMSIAAGAFHDSLGNASKAPEISDNSVTFTRLADGSFELTSAGPNPFWSSTSTRFGTSLCTTARCGTGGGTATPRTGQAWTWFDGSDTTAAEFATVAQSVPFPAGGSVSLSYYLRIGFVSAPSTSELRVKVDGTTVRVIPEPAIAESAYTQQTVDLSAYADGGSHTVSFEYERPSGAAFDSFSLDDVSLVLPPPPPVQISGKVMTPDGRGLRNAIVTITDSLGNRRTATTSSFGSYSFGDIPSGSTHTVTVSSKRYRFAPRVVTVSGDLSDMDFVALE